MKFLLLVGYILLYDSSFLKIYSLSMMELSGKLSEKLHGILHINLI